MTLILPPYFLSPCPGLYFHLVLFMCIILARDFGRKVCDKSIRKEGTSVDRRETHKFGKIRNVTLPVVSC